MSLYRNDDLRHARSVESGMHPLPCPADVPDMSNAAFDGDRPASENCEEETCPVGSECPGCGENRIDYLVWMEPDWEQVECATCGTVYIPGDTEIDVAAEIEAALAFERMGEKYAAREDGRPKGC